MDAAEDPLKNLSVLPADASEELEREWLQDTFSWLKTFSPESRTILLRHLCSGFEAEPALRERFCRIWQRGFPARLFAEAGLPAENSLFKELTLRIKRRLLPQPEQELDLYAALQESELTKADADWVASLGDDDARAWQTILPPATDSIRAALRILAVRAAATGLAPDLMRVMPYRHEDESPFNQLLTGVARYAETGTAELSNGLHAIILQCKLAAGVSHARLEELGVSSSLVFRLDLVIAYLDRMEDLLAVADGKRDARTFAAMLVRGFTEERGIGDVLRSSVNRLARHVVRYTGRSGEHYIAPSRAEWLAMGYGAIGGGAITAFTALFKYIFSAMPWAPLWIGVAHSLNYAISFVAMQQLGWPLASKMPAMTASALADAMEQETGMKEEVRLIAAISRSQFIVTFGNIFGAVPMALIIDFLLQWRTGHPFLSQSVAQHGLDSMRLFRSWTIPFAALTGCFLWMSSLAAGWTGNWVVLNRLPVAVMQSRRLGRVLSRSSRARIAAVLEEDLSGAAGYACLGLLFGLLPFIGAFAGAPIEVRHITLASASLTYDIRALIWFHRLSFDIFWALLGLVATGLLNFNVSFALGLGLAMRAKNLGLTGRKTLADAFWAELRRNPAAFFWKGFPAAVEAAPVAVDPPVRESQPL